MIEIIAIDTPSLGDRGYLATDGDVALVVDAQRDFDRVTAAAAERDVAITHVFETHVHNDYVTGGLALARAVGARYLVNAEDPVGFERTPVRDGEVIDVGGMTMQVIGTPGHTFTHLAYALLDRDGNGNGAVLAAFTGGSLLNGSTGRTDLLGASHARALSRAQFRSARRLARELPGTAQVCPTHGFGSFCAAGPATGTQSTIADEMRASPALTSDENDYVEGLLAGLEEYPAYYSHMGPANLAGPAAPDLSPPRQADPAELRRRTDAGEWVVDLRTRTAFAAGHLRGSLNFGTDGSLATYLGWLIPRGTPLTLIGTGPADVAHAQRELCRIGIDSITAAACWPEAGLAPLESYAIAGFAALAARMRGDDLDGDDVVVLDVRRDSEWRASHLQGAVHIPLHELPGRLGEIPEAEIWVHCAGGYRAAVAASLLAAHGRRVVAVNDDFEAAGQAGLTSAAGLGTDGPGRESQRPARHYLQQDMSAPGELRWPYAA
jgi:glyoxylase-like metal-dependent hydrolase (beta-lactamase superfamily II)/rhodanese-related sulfurtransferase